MRWHAGLLLAVLLLLVPQAGSAAEPATQYAAADSLSPAALAFTMRYGAPARPPRPQDKWWARDKARHVVFSALWTLSTQYVLVQKAGWQENDALPVSIGASAAVGLLKEGIDAQRAHGTASARDLAANAVGIGLATGIILLP